MIAGREAMGLGDVHLNVRRRRDPSAAGRRPTLGNFFFFHSSRHFFFFLRIVAIAVLSFGFGPQGRNATARYGPFPPVWGEQPRRVMPIRLSQWRPRILAPRLHKARAMGPDSEIVFRVRH